MWISSVKSVDEVVEQIMRIHRALPSRPGIEEVEAAKALISNVEKEDQVRLEAIAKRTKGNDVPDELFLIFHEMQMKLIYFQSKEQKREAVKLLDLENLHCLFDELVQRASRCVSSSSTSSHTTCDGSASTDCTSLLKSSANSAVSVGFNMPPFYHFEKETVKPTELFTRDDNYVTKVKSTFYPDGLAVRPSALSKPQMLDSSLKQAATSGLEGDKLSLIKLAGLIEVSAKKGTRDFNLQNKLMDQIDWLPDSIGKLSSLVTLDLSENQIAAIPETIGGLSSLTRLDLQSNRIVELPDPAGNLLSLVYLNLRGNQLSSLPATVGRLLRLEELDLSSNQFDVLPDSIGSLACLKTLNVETNNIEEIPYSIGRCTSLKAFSADYNRIKAIPEAVGKIETLESLSVRYNNVKQLPRTMSSLLNLRELDVSFNELETVPESLCFASSLVKLNISNNFADLRSLPRSIGNLEMLEELDISNNQIRVLPDSFKMLTKLRTLRVEENPLEVPPRHIAEKRAQAVVQYMAEHAERKEKENIKLHTVKPRNSWSHMFFFSSSITRKCNAKCYGKT